MRRMCKCGCMDFIVRYKQVTTYDVTLDINTGEWIEEESGEDVEEVDIDENTTFVCDECGEEYKHLEDIPEVEGSYEITPFEEYVNSQIGEQEG